MSYSVLVYYEAYDSKGKRRCEGNLTADIVVGKKGVAEEVSQSVFKYAKANNNEVTSVIIKNCTIFPHE